MLIHLLLYLLAFSGIWLGSGFIVASTTNFSRRLRFSPFAFSFVVLGLLTSIPEFSVGLQAVAGHDPEIFVGNLLGGILVLFLVVIPLLAIVGNGINLKHELDSKTMLATLGVILAPAFFILDRRVTNLEGVLLIGIYAFMLVIIQRKKGIFDRENTEMMNGRAYSYKDILKIVLGIVLVFLSSHLVVEKTLFFAANLHISAYYFSLVIIALGTDLPEISLALRSTRLGNKDVAMGDYIGAAAASTLLFGIFTVLHNGEVITVSSFLATFIFLSTALAFFFVLSYKDKFLSRREGILLLLVYCIFLFYEFVGTST